MDDLTDEQKALIDFERTTRWKFPGAREAAILERFGIPTTVYHQRLARVIEHPAALGYDVLTVRRLRRLRDARRAVRAVRARG